LTFSKFFSATLLYNNVKHDLHYLLEADRQQFYRDSHLRNLIEKAAKVFMVSDDLKKEFDSMKLISVRLSSFSTIATKMNRMSL